MYRFQSRNLSLVLESLPDSVMAMLETMKLESPTRAVVEINEERWVVESIPHPDTPNSLLTKRKKQVVATSSFRFRNSGRTNFTISRVRGSLSMMLTQSNK